MLIKYLLTISIYCLPLLVFAQKGLFEIGINYGPTWTITQKYDRPPAYNLSFGTFIHYNFRTRIGLGLGIQYQEQNLNTTNQSMCNPTDPSFLCSFPEQDNFEVIQVPIWFSLDLIGDIEADLKVVLIGGYALGTLLNRADKAVTYRLENLNNFVHYGMTGIEFKKAIMKELQVTLVMNVAMTNIYDQRYGEIRNLQLVLKIGKIFFNKNYPKL